MVTVTKKELVARLTHTSGLKGAAVKKVIQGFLDSIAIELSRGNRLEFRGFGVFEVKVRKAHRAHNPKTLVPIMVPDKCSVRFKVSKDLKLRLIKPYEAIFNLQDSEPSSSTGPSAKNLVGSPR